MQNDNGTSGLVVSTGGSIVGWGYLAIMKYIGEATSLMHFITACFTCCITFYALRFARYKWRNKKQFKDEE